MTDPRDPKETMRWIWRGSALAALLIGWVFIAWQNHFHITAPLVFVCLGYLAVVATIYNLWRTGAAAVASTQDEGDSTWAKPAGLLGELEREKRTLIKAIKEAEFDHQMGKLSQRDADDMIRTYRARAVEVLKEIDRIELGTAGSAREQILREVRARLQLEAKPNKKAAAEPKPGAKANGSKGEAAKGKKKKSPAQDVEHTTEPATAVPDAAASVSSELDEAANDAADKTANDAANDATKAAAAATASDDATDHAPPSTAPAAAKAAIDDEAMDADSTTAVEPTREDSAKEATP
jgi:hypothetical protein